MKMPVLPIVIILTLIACGQQAHLPNQPETAHAKPSSPPLTADEMAKLFLDGAKIWKFTSEKGIPAQSAHLVLIENGEKRGAIGHASPTTITKLIVAQIVMGDRHLVKMYVEHAHGSGTMSSDLWFSKPLMMAVSTDEPMAGRLQSGTTVLLGGTTESPAHGSTVSVSLDTAPCRLQLEIE